MGQGSQAQDICRRSKTPNRCTKCILPDNFPHTSFSQEGVCNYCETHTPIHYKGESALRSLLESYRGVGKKYDCIVPISGGKDSAYVLYSAVKEHNMRALAMNYDSGFTVDQAKKNLQNVVQSLSVDFVQITSSMLKKCLKDNIEAWLKRPSEQALPHFCYGCMDGFKGSARIIAAQMKIPLVLLGDSQMENLRLGSAFHATRTNLLQLATMFGRNPHYLHPRRLYHYVLVQARFTLPPHVCGLFGRDPRIVHWFDYVRYDNERILSTVIGNTGWEKPPHTELAWRFDCKIHSFKDRIYMRKFGYTERDELLSKMIREGSLTRDRAVELIEREENDERDATAMSEVLETLGLSEREERRFYELCID